MIELFETPANDDFAGVRGSSPESPSEKLRELHVRNRERKLVILRWSEERERRCASFKKQFMGPCSGNG